MFQLWQLDQNLLNNIARGRVASGRLDLGFVQRCLFGGAYVPVADLLADTLQEAVLGCIDPRRRSHMFCPIEGSKGIAHHGEPMFPDLFVRRDTGRTALFNRERGRFIAAHPLELVWRVTLPKAPPWLLDIEPGGNGVKLQAAIEEGIGPGRWQFNPRTKAFQVATTPFEMVTVMSACLGAVHVSRRAGDQATLADAISRIAIRKRQAARVSV